MINIYSIKEVIEASNNILHRTKSKTEINLANNSNQNKSTNLKKIKPLILIDEVLDETQQKKQNTPDDKNDPKEKKKN